MRWKSLDENGVSIEQEQQDVGIERPSHDSRFCAQGSAPPRNSTEPAPRIRVQQSQISSFMRGGSSSKDKGKKLA